jgi:hypothetical protein
MVGFIILRMYSDCIPNVLRTYSECIPIVGCMVCCLKLVAHTRSLRTRVRTSVPAQGLWLMVCLDVCGAATETARILEQVPWGVWEVLVGKAVAGFVFRLVRPHSIPRENN